MFFSYLSTNFTRIGGNFSFSFYIFLLYSSYKFIFIIVLNFSLFCIYFLIFRQKIKQHYNASALKRMGVNFSENMWIFFSSLQLYQGNSLFPRWRRLWEMCMVAWGTRSRRWLEARPWGEKTKTWSATVSSACQTFSIHRYNTIIT